MHSHRPGLLISAAALKRAYVYISCCLRRNRCYLCPKHIYRKFMKNKGGWNKILAHITAWLKMQMVYNDVYAQFCSLNLKSFNYRKHEMQPCCIWAPRISLQIVLQCSHYLAFVLWHYSMYKIKTPNYIQTRYIVELSTSFSFTLSDK